MSKNNIRTYPVKGLVIFCLIGFLICTPAFIWFLFIEELLVFRVLVYIFCPMFSLIALITIIDQLFHYVEVKEDVFINHIVFWTKKVKIEKIERFEICEGIYYIYYLNKKIASFPSQVVGADRVVIALERHGVIPKKVKGKTKGY
ncbi:MAG: hypothetical protein K6C32_00580 [Bacilli bacterium]|nr:hypothetical protein [Bacilli bacterium]